MKQPTPSGRREALSRLYDETGFLVHRRCLQMVGDPQTAHDVTQWTYLRAWETGFEVHSRAQALSWLYQTATRRCLTLLRNRASRRNLRHLHGELLVPSGPADAEALSISRQHFERAIARLPERDASFVLQTFVQGDSVQRVAEREGVSTRTVTRARRAFEQALEEEA
ncbi:MAG: RNA polymerase sigma factor [Deltaproteobacteria bacterium]|nr:MAG: RNA polymerase sigma factor [Deltaproteobacteria bacterium]